MDPTRDLQPGPESAPPQGVNDSSWSVGGKMPPTSSASALVRPDAEVCELIGPTEARPLLNQLSVLSAQLTCGEIVVPSGVSHSAIHNLVAEWKQTGNLDVGRNSGGEFIIRSHPGNEEYESHFAVFTPSKHPLIAGLLTDRDLKEHWPEPWRDYADLQGKRLLDHCCGLGKKVELLRQQGVDAHGVDIIAFGARSSDVMHYGRAERLPFMDKTFDRVESRMGVLLWGQDDREMCRKSLAEMARVTREGGTIRIMPVRDELIRELVAERPDLSFVEQSTGYFGAFEIRVDRGQKGQGRSS